MLIFGEHSIDSSIFQIVDGIAQVDLLCKRHSRDNFHFVVLDVVIELLQVHILQILKFRHFFLGVFFADLVGVVIGITHQS